VAAHLRAQQAETTREEEAQRRVAEERLRIAQELHDVIAHHVSVINVQSGVARHLLQRDPDRAGVALDVVREASRAALAETAQLVGLLRNDEEGLPTSPAPGLDRLDELVEATRRAGLEVQLQRVGQPLVVAPAADLVAYRVVQEALTNALKHGAGTDPAAGRAHRQRGAAGRPQPRRRRSTAGPGFRSGPDRHAGAGEHRRRDPHDRPDEDGWFAISAQIPRASR
jgi:signal transduction histidine kinase